MSGGEVSLWQEIVFPVASVVLFLVYQYRLLIVDAKHSSRSSRWRTVRGTMRDARLAWTRRHHMKGAVPVNTIRDMYRPTVFFGSATLLVSFAVVQVLLDNYGRCFPQAVRVNNEDLDCSPAEQVFVIKSYVLIADLFMGFLRFTLDLRFLKNSSYLLNVDSISGSRGCPPARVTPELVNRYLTRAHTHHAYGLRHLYIAGPLLLWYITPWLMFIGTILVLALLRHVDYIESPFDFVEEASSAAALCEDVDAKRGPVAVSPAPPV